MTQEQFIAFLTDLADCGIEVHQQVEMTEVNGEPILDRDGIQQINDVVKAGDAYLYIERNGNHEQGEQDFIDFLAGLDEFLPDIVAALNAYWN